MWTDPRGQGSVFFLVLPASTHPVEKEQEPFEKIVAGSGTILLVHDEERDVNVGGQTI